MITDSYDILTEPTSSPRSFYGEREKLCDVCIITFSYQLIERAKELYPCRQVSEISAANGSVPVYVMELGDRTVGIYLSHIGSALAGNDVIEVNCLIGAVKFIMFGSSGSLRHELTDGNLVVPTEAYRDEGMSYHYAPPADYIALPTAPRTAELLTELGVPHIEGRVWTTDAFYRETRGQIARRQSEGCLAVDMEIAGVQAVCSFHGWELYDFLSCGDVLDKEEYELAGLAGANHRLDNLKLAAELAKRI